MAPGELQLSVKRLAGAALFMFAVWASAPLLFGRAEPWDSPYPYYSLASLLGGLLMGLLWPRHYLAFFLGAWAGQVAALLALPPYEYAWLPLGIITTGLGSLFFLGGTVAGSQGQSRRRSNGKKGVTR